MLLDIKLFLAPLNQVPEHVINVACGTKNAYDRMNPEAWIEFQDISADIRSYSDTFEGWDDASTTDNHGND